MRYVNARNVWTDPRLASPHGEMVMARIRRDTMSRVVGARLGTELQNKLDTLCKDTQQRKSDVLRQALQVVSVEQLRQATQESRAEQAEREAS
jgi:predicted transcriptional regulator